MPQNWIGSERTEDEWQTFESALSCMVKFYASVTATCVIQQRRAPPRPIEYDGCISILHQAPDTDLSMLRKRLETYGQVVGDIDLVPSFGRGKREAHVRFATQEQAEHAILRLAGGSINSEAANPTAPETRDKRKAAMKVFDENVRRERVRHLLQRCWWLSCVLTLYMIGIPGLIVASNLLRQHRSGFKVVGGSGVACWFWLMAAGFSVGMLGGLIECGNYPWCGPINFVYLVLFGPPVPFLYVVAWYFTKIARSNGSSNSQAGSPSSPGPPSALENDNDTDGGPTAPVLAMTLDAELERAKQEARDAMRAYHEAERAQAAAPSPPSSPPAPSNTNDLEDKELQRARQDAREAMEAYAHVAHKEGAAVKHPSAASIQAPYQAHYHLELQRARQEAIEVVQAYQNAANTEGVTASLPENLAQLMSDAVESVEQKPYMQKRG